MSWRVFPRLVVCLASSCSTASRFSATRLLKTIATESFSFHLKRVDRDLESDSTFFLRLSAFEISFARYGKHRRSLSAYCKVGQKAEMCLSSHDGAQKRRQGKLGSSDMRGVAGHCDVARPGALFDDSLAVATTNGSVT